MVYNKNTKKYVLWVNLNGGKADYAVGTSSTPEGPFVFSNYANAAVQGGGDFDILIDDDAARLATPPTNKQTKRLGAAQRAACAVAALSLRLCASSSSVWVIRPLPHCLSAQLNVIPE